MADQDGSALLNILEEKDKLILSLKEASTRRDKLNETQIKMLSVDNQKKTDQLKAIQQMVKDLQYQVLKKESEISIYQVTNEKITDKLENLKKEITSYKTNVTHELTELKDSIKNELILRDQAGQHLTDELRNSITKLEAKLKEMEEYYAGVFKTISDKQGQAKKMIREAIDNLQDSMNLLDLGNYEIMKPKSIVEEFGNIADSTRQAIANGEQELRAEHAGATIVKNIENVNIKLLNNPNLDNVFSDIRNISTSAHEEMQKLKGLRQGFDDPSLNEDGGTGGSNNHDQENGQGDNTSSAGTAGSGAGTKAAGSNMSGAAGSGMGASQSSANFQRPQQQNGPVHTIDDRENFAPFDWEKILNDMELKKYSDLIRICNQSIKAGDFVKAIKLFRTIRDQPGISGESITTKMIDDEIDFLEKKVKDKYTRKI